MNNALTYFSILIAVNTATWKFISDSPLKFIGVNLATIIVCVIINQCETKIKNSQLKLLDFIIYLLTRDRSYYQILSRTDIYTISSETEATLSSTAHVKAKRVPEKFCYTDHFQWEQDEAFKVDLDSKYKYYFEEDLNWFRLIIEPKNFIMKNRQEESIGYKISNLHISNLKKHSFLSCRPIDKIKVLEIAACVNDSLKPAAYAKYMIQNKNGEVIHMEKLLYNAGNQSYEKTIKYPRKSRKYIIKWDYQSEKGTSEMTYIP